MPGRRHWLRSLAGITPVAVTRRVAVTTEGAQPRDDPAEPDVRFVAVHTSVRDSTRQPSAKMGTGTVGDALIAERRDREEAPNCPAA